MSEIVVFLLLSAIFVVVIIIVNKKPKRIMQEGKLMKSEMVYKDGEKFYVEKVVCNEVVALVRSFRPISIDEFDRIAVPLVI